jgi:hypothetical protein
MPAVEDDPDDLLSAGMPSRTPRLLRGRDEGVTRDRRNRPLLDA